MKINDLTEQQAKDILKEIVSILDDLDCDDFFGTEGWRENFEMDVEI